MRRTLLTAQEVDHAIDMLRAQRFVQIERHGKQEVVRASRST
jgi:hypothetical protein